MKNVSFRQLIDIAGVDYPEEEKRFKLVYLFFLMKITIELKFQLNLKPIKLLIQLQKYFHQLIGWKEKFLICMV